MTARDKVISSRTIPMLALRHREASNEGNQERDGSRAISGWLSAPPRLLSWRGLDGPVQGLVQSGTGALIFTLRNAALLMFHFELKQVILELVEKRVGWVGEGGRASGAASRKAAAPISNSMPPITYQPNLPAPRVRPGLNSVLSAGVESRAGGATVSSRTGCGAP